MVSDLMRNIKADELGVGLRLSHSFHFSGSQISFRELQRLSWCLITQQACVVLFQWLGT